MPAGAPALVSRTPTLWQLTRCDSCFSGAGPSVCKLGGSRAPCTPAPPVLGTAEPQAPGVSLYQSPQRACCLSRCSGHLPPLPHGLRPGTGSRDLPAPPPAPPPTHTAASDPRCPRKHRQGGHETRPCSDPVEAPTAPVEVQPPDGPGTAMAGARSSSWWPPGLSAFVPCPFWPMRSPHRHWAFPASPNLGKKPCLWTRPSSPRAHHTEF